MLKQSCIPGALDLATLEVCCRSEIEHVCLLETINAPFSFELLHRATSQDNQQAWEAWQRCCGEILRSWLHAHPSRDAACGFKSEEHYVALAFAGFQQAAIEKPMTFNTLAEALIYLCACLNGVIVETLRVFSCPGAVSLTEPETEGEPNVEDHRTLLEVWDRLQARLSSERERRLAYLIYQCGLSPSEILRCCPQEWSDVQEINRLRCTILERLLPDVNQLSYR